MAADFRRRSTNDAFMMDASYCAFQVSTIRRARPLAALQAGSRDEPATSYCVVSPADAGRGPAAIRGRASEATRYGRLYSGM